VTEPASTTFQVGQKVLVTHPERRPIETEVTKVGRSLVHVPNMAFHMDTGTERRGLNAAGYAHRLLTPEQYAEEQERIRLRADLGQAGINFADFNGSAFTTSQMKRLLAVALDDSPQTES
jgi:hypothetical protein